MDNYIMIEGRKIEISEDTAKNIKETFIKVSPIEEFVNFMSDGGYAEYVLEGSYIDGENMFIKIPPANASWCFDVFDAAKEYYGKTSNYPTGCPTKSGYLTIRIKS